jgi:hypothetical protein
MEPEFHAALVAGLCPLEVMRRAGRPQRARRSFFSWTRPEVADEGTDYPPSPPAN